VIWWYIYGWKLCIKLITLIFSLISMSQSSLAKFFYEENAEMNTSKFYILKAEFTFAHIWSYFLVIIWILIEWKIILRVFFVIWVLFYGSEFYISWAFLHFKDLINAIEIVLFFFFKMDTSLIFMDCSLFSSRSFINYFCSFNLRFSEIFLCNRAFICFSKRDT